MTTTGRKPDVMTARLDASHRNLPDPTQAAGVHAVVELEPPTDMSEAALEVWHVATPPLLEAKVLRAEDILLVVEFCEAYAMARTHRETAVLLQAEFDKALKGGPEVGEETKDWAVRLDAMSSQIKRERAGYVQTLKLALSMAADLGIGPVARVRLGLATVQGASLLDALNRRPSES